MKWYRYSRICLLLFLVLLVSSACSEQPAPYLRIGTNLWPGYQPLHLADDLGYYDDKRIHLVGYASATQVISDFNNNAIEGAALTLDEVLLLKQYDVDVYIVLVMDFSNGGDVIMAHPALQDMQELKGHRIAAENTALGAYVLSRALEQSGLSLNDVTIVLKERHEQIDAYIKGEVDAVVSFDPVRTRLAEEGAIEIFDSSQIPGEIVDVLVVRKDYFDRHTAVVTDLLIGWFRALRYMDDNTQAAHKIMAERMKMPVDKLNDSLADMRIPSAAENHDLIYSGRLRSTLAKNATRLEKTMLENQLLGKDIYIEALFIKDASYFLDIVEGLEAEPVE